MKNFIGILKKTKLFRGIGERDIEAMLSCLDAQIRKYRKGEYVFRAGEFGGKISVLVEGELHIQNDDYWGNRSIVGRVGVGEMFGEAYSVPGGEVMANDVVAQTDTTVIFFDVNRILCVCSSACAFHSAVVRNLFFAISEKNRRLVDKMGHITKRTTREKLLSYLSSEAKKNGSSCFEIPFNRQQLADFLSVDRSAMSSELCRMRDDGILSFKKNHFELKTAAAPIFR